MSKKIKFKYYYPVYRASVRAHFRIKLGTLGHIMVNDKILCGQEVATKEKFMSYTIEHKAKPGYSLCAECAQKRAELKNGKPTDQEKLKRWLESSEQLVRRSQ